MSVLTVEQLLDNAAAAVGTVSNVGKVQTVLAPIHDWEEYASRHIATVGGVDRVRAVVIEFRSRGTVDVAVPGYLQDTYTFAIWTVYQGDQDLATMESVQRDAIEHCMDVLGALDARQSSSGVTAEVERQGPCQLQSIDWAYFGDIGCWVGKATYPVVCRRDVAWT